MKLKNYNLKLLCLMLLMMLGASGLYAVDYLCFTAEEAGSVSLSVNGSISADIWTSADSINWANYTLGAQIDLLKDEKVYFKGNYRGSGGGNYASFVMSGKISASGNIMTLTDGGTPTLSLAEKDSCFYRLFYNCGALTTAPELPATTLASRCYAQMFFGCTNLTAAPALPALDLEPRCYFGMFLNCTKLTAAPTLSATDLADYCYEGMFENCTSLKTAPALPATTLMKSCYYKMFLDCTELETAPVLPATTLAETCYKEMFKGCSKLNYLKVNFTSWTDATNPTLDWVKDVSATGTFVCPESLDVSVKDASHVPVNWTVETTPAVSVDYLCFTAEEAYSSVKLSVPTSITANIQTSTDGVTWTNYVSETNITLSNKGDKVYFKGDYRGTGTYTRARFIMTGKIAASGNVMTLTDGDSPTNSLAGKDYCFNALFSGCESSLITAPELPADTLAPYCYANMFWGCTGLTAAPALPASKLADHCYNYMFLNCTGLTTAPALPADTLVKNCYRDMFDGCTKLTTAPQLPATTLAETCYAYMFRNCTGLINPPVLPADTLALGCYRNMFEGCTGLAAAPELPADTLEFYCYDGMFEGCTNLTDAPALPATKLANYCYNDMFKGCTGLTDAPVLPATRMPVHCYSGMFSECTNLTVAPQLPAEILANGCYAGMFADCKSLKTAPALPATELAIYCYQAMFARCDSLTNAPALPATTMTTSCYEMMFSGCKELETAPVLPAATLATRCYASMFNGCSKLNYLKVNFTSWTDASNVTLDWVSNVSATGTFVCPMGLDVSNRDASHVPEGWTVDFTSGISPVINSRFDPKGVFYNISGQKVDENYKGIVIQNGKKYFRH